MRFYHRVMPPKDADGMANSVEGLQCILSPFCPKTSDHNGTGFEPAHEIMALFVLRKLILQTRMRSHPVWLDV